MHDSVLAGTVQVPPLTSSEQIPTLQSLAFKTVRRTLGLARLNKAPDLPLPPSITDDLSRVTHQDFVYDTTVDDPDQFRDGLYPAVCTIDGAHVHIRISHNSGSTTLLSQDPSYITSLSKDDHTYYVFARTVRLPQKIRDLRCRHFPTQMVWHLLIKMATQCQNLHSTHLFTAHNIHFYKDHVFIRPFYARQNLLPPIMSQQNLTEPAEQNGGLILCIGRVIEEMFSWFSLFQRQEAVTSRTSLGRLRLLVNDCLVDDASRRPSLYEIKRIAQQNI